VIEVVSDRTGGEDSLKKSQYAQLGVLYYAVLDPEHYLSDELLRIWELRKKKYERIAPGYWPEIGLGLTLWEGTFEGHTDTWLRWCDEKGEVIPTAEEQAQQANDRARKAEDRAQKAEDRIRELEEALRRLQGSS
jgi:hypothetical protein